MPDLDNAILKAYQSGAIGNGVNHDPQGEGTVVTTHEVEAAVEPTLSPAQQRKRDRDALVRVSCSHARKIHCTRPFADEACCNTVATGWCDPPGAIRMQFVAKGNASKIQAMIASGAFVWGNK